MSMSSRAFLHDDHDDDDDDDDVVVVVVTVTARCTCSHPRPGHSGRDNLLKRSEPQKLRAVLQGQGTTHQRRKWRNGVTKFAAMQGSSA